MLTVYVLLASFVGQYGIIDSAIMAQYDGANAQAVCTNVAMGLSISGVEREVNSLRRGKIPPKAITYKCITIRINLRLLGRKS